MHITPSLQNHHVYKGFERNPDYQAKPDSKAWENQIDRWADAPPVLGDDGDVFVTGIQHRLYNLDAQTGDIKWQTDAGDLLYSPPQKGSDQTLVLNSHAHGADRELLIGVDAKNGNVKWSYQQNKWGQTDIADGAVYSLLTQGFSSIDTDTGIINWSVPVDNEARSEPVLGPDGSIYLCEDDERLRNFSKLNSETGEKEWSIYADDSSVSFSPDGFLGVRHSKYDDDFNVIANQFELRSPETGQKLWTRDRMGLSYTTQFLDHDRLLMKSYEDWSDAHYTLESLDTKTGEVKWSKDLPPFAAVETASNGLLVTKSTKREQESGEVYGHDLIALDPETGDKKWSFQPKIDEWQNTHMKETGVYVSGRRDIEGSDRRYRSVLFAVNQETGEKKWEYDFGLDHHQVIEDPESQRLYVSVGENKVVCLDSESGEALWHVKSDIAVEVSDELTADGRLLLTDLNGNVAAVSADSPVAIPGDVPQDPDKDHGMPVFTRGYSAQFLMEHSKPVLGKQQDVIVWDPEDDQKVEGWEPILIRDVNGDGEYTNADLQNIPDRAYLESLDADQNGLLLAEEIDDLGLVWWGDRDEDGQIGGDEYFRDRNERLIDLERLHETERYS